MRSLGWFFNGDLLVVKGIELNDNTSDWHEIVVNDDVEGVQHEVKAVDQQISHSVAILLVLLL